MGGHFARWRDPSCFVKKGVKNTHTRTHKMQGDRLVCAYLEQLYANDSEHELEETCHENDIPDCLNGYDNALNDVLEERTRLLLWEGVRRDDA